MATKSEEYRLKKALELIKSLQNPASHQQIIRTSSHLLGNKYLQTKQIDLAEKLYLIANYIIPNNSHSLAVLSKFYYEHDSTDKAYNFILKAVENSPCDDIDLLLNAAIIAADFGHTEKALEFYTRILSLDPDHKKAKFGLAVENFKQGNICKAYEMYINRHAAFDTDEKLDEDIKAIPRWDGRSKGTVAIYNEQGYGDFIFGIRYLQLIKNKFCFYIDNNLNSLFKSTIYECLNKRVLKKVDYRCSMLDIPTFYMCGSDLDESYKEIFRWKKPAQSQKIGLVFSGGKSYSADHRRSIKLSYFQDLLQNKNYKITLYQKDLKDNEFCDIAIPPHVKIFDCKNFYETAQSLRKENCLLTVDTSVAHLGGALNIPTFVLLDKFPDYRWWENDHSTRWYKSWRLYKQETRGCWKAPVANACRDIKKIFNVRLRSCR